MSDTFLPGSGFDTYEQQDKVLVGLCGGTGCKAAVRILQQQGFAVMGAVVRLCTDDPVVDAAKEAAKALGIECITLNASELASQLAEATAAPADLRFPALLAAADRLGIQSICALATTTMPILSGATTGSRSSQSKRRTSIERCTMK